jgi:tartrate dehydratase beta subunit/fumarate hydratase class I family protein
MAKQVRSPEFDVFHNDSRSMKEPFGLAIEEITSVLQRKRAITDVTKVASVTLSTYGKIRSTEVHEMALHVMMNKKGHSLKSVEA